MSIIDYLYKGAPPGAQQAAQQAAKNTSYGTMVKTLKDLILILKEAQIFLII